MSRPEVIVLYEIDLQLNHIKEIHVNERKGVLSSIAMKSMKSYGSKMTISLHVVLKIYHAIGRLESFHSELVGQTQWRFFLFT